MNENRRPLEYNLVLRLSVEESSALWAAAAARCERETGLTPEEIVETIGPREDPSVLDCIVTLVLPTSLAGCRLIDFSI